MLKKYILIVFQSRKLEVKIGIEFGTYDTLTARGRIMF